MATSVDTQTPSPAQSSMDAVRMGGAASSSPLLSPSSDKRFWSNLRNRVDNILEQRKGEIERSVVESQRVNRLREDSKLLLRGFDSIAQTLSQLSNNLDNALQGARDLAQPPTLTEIFHINLKNMEAREESPNEEQEETGTPKGKKRKHDTESSSDDQADESPKEEGPKRIQVMKRAKHVAISMAARATTLAKELKSIKSDLCFMQERCALLEEENRKLRDGFVKGVRPEEDDLVRLQLEALLAEKSRLANENANLVRENQCLHQLVEYHQIASQDLSASYEEVLQGLCLDFSSPLPEVEEETDNTGDGERGHIGEAQGTGILNLSTSLDERFKEEH